MKCKQDQKSADIGRAFVSKFNSLSSLSNVTLRVQ